MKKYLLSLLILTTFSLSFAEDKKSDDYTAQYIGYGASSIYYTSVLIYGRLNKDDNKNKVDLRLETYVFPGKAPIIAEAKIKINYNPDTSDINKVCAEGIEISKKVQCVSNIKVDHCKLKTYPGNKVTVLEGNYKTDTPSGCAKKDEGVISMIYPIK